MQAALVALLSAVPLRPAPAPACARRPPLRSRAVRSRAAAAEAVSLEEWECVVGLEVHVQLRTASKAFCACANAFGAPPNAHTCPVCLARPPFGPWRR